jgi:hypothetical protein
MEIPLKSQISKNEISVQKCSTIWFLEFGAWDLGFICLVCARAEMQL